MVFKKVFLFLFILFFAASARTEYYQFIPGFEDIPLMDGLAQIEDGVTSFDSPEGSFTEVNLHAEPRIKAEHVFAYYGAVLPALGWQKSTGNCFEREGESLCIFYESGIVRFELKS